MSIITTQLQRDRKGLITANKSPYKPSEKEQDRISMILRDFTSSQDIMNKTYREFNDLSLIDRQSKDQRSFNAWQEHPSENPDEAWKSNAVRPITRNKIISTAAHVAGTMIFPKIFAQNENDDQDKDAETVMRDLMEWRADQANYERTYLFSIIAALVNPAVIVHTEYRETFRNIKKKQIDGTLKKETVLDDLFSGFQDTLVPVDEMFIENIYENNIQKQGYLIWRRFLSFESAEAKYGDNPTFREHVRPGVQIMFDDAEATFYEQYDKDLEDRLVEEVIYYNRSQDLQLVVINGVLLSDPDEPNPREDKMYPFAKTGYELIDEGKFFYYRSLANKTSVDEDLVNILYRMVMDGTFLEIMPPTAVFGDEDIDASVIAPGMVTPFDSETKLQTISTGANLTAGFNALNKAEASLSESSSDPLQSGQATAGTQTAFEISRLEQNARTILGLFGQMAGFLVKDLGQLFVSDIIQYMTVGEVSELTGMMKFRNFVLPDKDVDGKKKTRKIEFDMDLPAEVTEEDELDQSFKIMGQEGGLESENSLLKVNPTLFRKMKFKTKVSPDIITPPSDAVKKAFNLEEYDRAIANPLVDQEAVTRDLLLGSYEATKDDPEKYLKKQEEMAPKMGALTGKQPNKQGALANAAAQAEQAGTPMQ